MKSRRLTPTEVFIQFSHSSQHGSCTSSQRSTHLSKLSDDNPREVESSRTDKASLPNTVKGSLWIFAGHLGSAFGTKFRYIKRLEKSQFTQIESKACPTQVRRRRKAKLRIKVMCGQARQALMGVILQVLRRKPDNLKTPPSLAVSVVPRMLLLGARLPSCEQAST